MKNFLIVLFSLVLFQCTNTEQAQVDEYRKTVMDLHDEEMAKMDKIYSYKEQLNQLKDSISNDSIKKEIILRIQSLEKADKSMMDWMHTYREPTKEMKSEEKINYFLNQLKAMTAVKTVMNNSLDSAAHTIEQYKK